MRMVYVKNKYKCVLQLLIIRVGKHNLIKYKKIAYEEAEKIGAEVIEIKAKEKTEEISDYFGMVSGIDEDKIAKAGVHVTKSEFVDAPIIEEYPLTLECKVESFIMI